MKILFTRHGQTDWNIQYKIQGQIEIPLNDTGIKQAQDLHDSLLNTKIDIIFTSPLGRAKNTALIIRGDRDIPLFEDKRLLEEYYGDLEGAPRKDNPVYIKQRNSFFKRYPNGESYFDVYARVSSFFQDLKKNYEGKVDTVLIVGHGGMSRVVNIYFQDMENDQFVSYGIDNCELKEYEL